MATSDKIINLTKNDKPFFELTWHYGWIVRIDKDLHFSFFADIENYFPLLTRKINIWLRENHLSLF